MWLQGLCRPIFYPYMILVDHALADPCWSVDIRSLLTYLWSLLITFYFWSLLTYSWSLLISLYSVLVDLCVILVDHLNYLVLVDLLMILVDHFICPCWHYNHMCLNSSTFTPTDVYFISQPAAIKQIKIDLFLYISKEQRRKKSCLVIVSRRGIFFSCKMLKARVEVRERDRAPYNDRTVLVYLHSREKTIALKYDSFNMPFLAYPLVTCWDRMNSHQTSGRTFV